MSELISKEEVKATIKSILPSNPLRSTLLHMINVMESAKENLVHDLDQEQVCEWKFDGYALYQCSCTKHYFDFKSNYCPDCGNRIEVKG